MFYTQKRRSISSWVTKIGSIVGATWTLGFLYYYLHRAFSEHIVTGIYKRVDHGDGDFANPLYNENQTLPITEWWNQQYNMSDMASYPWELKIGIYGEQDSFDCPPGGI